MRLLYLFGMVEQPPGVFRHIAGGCNEGLQQRPFPGRRCLPVLRSHLVEHFPPGLTTQRLFHSFLIWKRTAGDRCVEATDFSSLLTS
jgi:hypothetical protein